VDDRQILTACNQDKLLHKVNMISAELKWSTQSFANRGQQKFGDMLARVVEELDAFIWEVVEHKIKSGKARSVEPTEKALSLDQIREAIVEEKKKLGIG